MPHTKQKLILLFDGTWNDPQSRTNVYRMAKSIKHFDEKGVRQKFFYSPGVGTKRNEKIRGGATGYGLTQILFDAYDWLCRNYTAHTEIFVFGFSRGAFTARSFGGLIRKCGVLWITTPVLLNNAREVYMKENVHPDDNLCKNFRLHFSQEAEIHFMGVWDTVGALGIPRTTFTESEKYKWHDTNLTSIVKHAYHAMALDEHRKAYDITFWTSQDGSKKPSQKEVEQRWFIGAHANVGGGYDLERFENDYDPLAKLSFDWIAEKAVKAGLELKHFEKAPDHAIESTHVDSYRDFMRGVYRAFRWVKTFGKGRYFRKFDRGPEDIKAVNVTVDGSVWKRWNADPDYRPPTLVNAHLEPPA